MSDLAERMARARGALRDGATPRRLEVVEGRLRLARARRARAQRLGVVALVAVGLAVLAVRGRERATPAIAAHGTAARPAARPGAATIRLADGSTITPQGDDALVEPSSLADGLVRVRLVRGRARFEVTHVPGRVFRVEAGDVAVQVLGTVFTVARDGATVRAWVEQGRIRVFYAGAFADLGPGESGAFPPPARPTAVASVATSLATPTAEERTASRGALRSPPVHARPAANDPEPGWQALARGQRMADAYAVLARDGVASVHDAPDELMLAVDVLRFNGHAGQAVAPLERLLAGHGDDPHAPLAAFTLGAILLDELDRPRDAAAAFARAVASGPPVLVEDALAREVEALARAGETSAAREHAQAYLARYPHGAWATSVRRQCGLE